MSCRPPLYRYRRKLWSFLHGPVSAILEGWRKEAEVDQDMRTACVVHSFLALLWVAHPRDTHDANSVVQILSSLVYVRNWHGFGTGRLGTRGRAGASGLLSSPEMRLRRFLQVRYRGRRKICNLY